jgi:inorganic triphosphatase YgiF
MSSHPREIELKLEASRADIGQLKRALGRNHGLHQQGSPERERLETTYFDTSQLDLRQAGVQLRVRRAGDRHVQTIKRVERSDAGLFDRGEWEQDIAGDRPDFTALKKLDLGRTLNEKIRRTATPVVKTVVTRAAYRLGDRQGSMKLALDEGYVAACGRRLPINEVELELERGNPAQLFATARRRQRIAPLRLGIDSKADRGFGLVAQRTPLGPAKSGKLSLRRGMTAGEAFRAIGHDCLRQLVANEPALQRQDFEAVHQMRVALRRLRSAISLFEEVVHDTRVDRIKSELKWLTEEFGPARELDVFFTTAPRAGTRRANGDDIATGHERFRTELDRRRCAALERARRAVDSFRCRKMVLDTIEWLTIGPWTSTRSPRRREVRDCAIETYSSGELSRRRDKIKKRGRKLRELNARQRHKLRINVKKLRYATDYFFAALFPGKKAKRRRQAFAAALKGMQNALGRLNDIAAHKKISLDVARAGPVPPPGRRRAFAAGMVVGEETAQMAALLDEAAHAHGEFEKVKPFWT